jgi:hypothetical protein
VGDSRIYLIRGDQIRQLSIDHTWIQEALDNNILTPDQVEGQPHRHVIRRYLGGPTPPEIDFRMQMLQGETEQLAHKNQGVTLQTGDRLLLTSDGLTDLVNNEEILEAFKVGDDNLAVDNLIDLANERGGHDNITVITFVVPDGIQAVTKKRSFLPLGCVVAAIAAFVVAAIIFGYFWLQSNNMDFNLFNRNEQPAQVTLNPMMTSAPQTTATGGEGFSVQATVTPGDANTPKLVSTQTSQPLFPESSESGGYPPPQEAVLTPVTPQAYP